MKTITLCLLRLVLSLLFALSGIIKILDPGRFFLDVKAFELLNEPAAYAAALFLPCFEIIAACCLWVPGLRRGAALLLALSTLSFIAALSITRARGLDIDCGCFGEWLVFPSFWAHIGFNTFLTLGATVLLCKKCTGKAL
jgi:uncharacterized membrane protein YphA (DoxX/SURF4 family)